MWSRNNWLNLLFTADDDDVGHSDVCRCFKREQGRIKNP